MRILKFFIALVGFVSFSSCTEDWGQMDAPAGNQTNPTREQVATYGFEYDEETVVLSDMDKTYVPDGKVCEVIEDETLSSNVLHLDSGYVRLANPLNNVTLQDGAALTMWVKLSHESLDKALFSFGYDDLDSTRFYFTPNAQLVYTKPGQLESLNLDENNPSSVKTGALAADSAWHFLAVQVGDDGYQVYVDGLLRANQTQQKPEYDTDFDYQTLVEHLNKAPYIYIGAGADTLMAEACYDDITIFRNHMEEKDWNKSLSGGSGGGGSVDSDPIATITEIGTSDCSAAWWTTFSDYYTIKPNEALHYSFTNHTSGAGNWNNWNLCVSTNAERDTGDYAEYFVIRSDLYGWGDNYAAGTWDSEGYGDWDAFRADMEGAKVDIDIVRSGVTVTVTAVANCTNGNVYKEVFSTDCGDGSQKINAFLIVDGSYLVMDTANTYYYQSLNNAEIGTSDCSAAWWTTFSDYYTIPAESTRIFEFTNHTSGAGNWNNWNLCVSTPVERDATGYAEYFVIRSDLYGWGDTYAVGTWESEGYGDWDAFRADMEGASVSVTITRSGTTVKVTAVATCTNGNVYKEVFTTTAGDGKEDMNAFFIVDGSYLVFHTIGRPCFAQ